MVALLRLNINVLRSQIKGTTIDTRISTVSLPQKPQKQRKELIETKTHINLETSAREL